MRLVQLYLPGDREDVLDTLDEEGVDYLMAAAENRDGFVVNFPLPEEGVDELLTSLRDVGLPDDAYTVVLDAETVTTPDFERLREEYAEDEADESLATEQLRDQAEELNPSWLTFATAAVLSAVVVSAGLLRNSAAAVAGAMVIAPYFGTALSVSVGVVGADRYLFLDGVKHQTAGLTLSIASATAVGVVARELALVPPGLPLVSVGQVSIFLTPTLLSLFVATAAGTAGAMAFSTSTSVTISGVAIAAAIVPSAGVVGLGIAWGNPSLVVGSAALLAMNVLCVNAAAVVVLVALGNRPGEFQYERVSPIPPHRLVAGLVAVIVLAGAILGGTVATAHQIAFDRATTQSVHETLSRPRYDGLSVASVQVEFAGRDLLPGESDVWVTVVADSTGSYPKLPDALERAVEARTDDDVSVHVRYVTYDDGDHRPHSGSSFASLASTPS